MHRIQKDILNKLIRSPAARYAQLRPKELDGNIFTYHLQQLIAAKLVKKSDDGSYALTQKGKLAGININLSAQDNLHQSHSVLLLAAKKNDSWLLRKRTVHPAYGKIGFIHFEPVPMEPIVETARRGFQLRSGLKANFKVRGGGYITLIKDGELESFVHFTLLYADKVSGQLIPGSDTGENLWYEGDFSDASMIPSMSDLVRLIESQQQPFFTELSYEV